VTGSLDVLKYLIQFENTWPALGLAFSKLVYCATRNRIESMKLLMDHPAMDISVHIDHILSNAVLYHYDEIRILLSDERVNPFGNELSAFNIAVQYDRDESLRILMHNKRPRESHWDDMEHSNRTVSNLDIMRYALNARSRPHDREQYKDYVRLGDSASMERPEDDL
jgi:hypothetical protein